MNTVNLASQDKESQRIIKNSVVSSNQAEIDTELYIGGQSDAAFEVPPQSNELPYLAGYKEEYRRNQIIKDNPLPDELYEKTQQGILLRLRVQRLIQLLQISRSR